MEKKEIKNESELKKWFIKNYKKLGYSKIIRKDMGECPDFVMMKAGKEVMVELETCASNFILHKHELDKVDEIVCVINDMDLVKPVIDVKELEFKGNPNTKVTLSIDEEVYKKFQKYCWDNAIMPSKRLELEMQKIMKEKEKK